MRTAVVHARLISRGGAENALTQILRLFPEADLRGLARSKLLKCSIIITAGYRL